VREQRDGIMEKDVLAAVIEIEKEIEERLESERRKISRWLDNAKKEIEAELAAEAGHLEDSIGAAVSAARETAEKRTSAMLLEMEEQSRRMSGTGDETLSRIIAEHIGRILPGNDRDSKNVQS
jgi:hypothetical protein